LRRTASLGRVRAPSPSSRLAPSGRLAASGHLHPAGRMPSGPPALVDHQRHLPRGSVA
jgi:hypothetical protein